MRAATDIINDKNIVYFNQNILLEKTNGFVENGSINDLQRTIKIVGNCECQ